MAEFAPGQRSDALRWLGAVTPGKIQQPQHRAHAEVFSENHIQDSVVVTGLGSEKESPP